MNAIGIIPARMDASRFSGKPMAPLLGMPMIGHCYHRTRLAPGLSKVYVATCDQIIADYIESIGGRAVMTSPLHDRATTRTAEALGIIEKELSEPIDIVVMVQGDEPTIAPNVVAETLTHFNDEKIKVVNIMSKISSKDVFFDQNNVKVVTDCNSDALYFSREPIPSPWKGWEQLPRFMQTGIIAFRSEALIEFNLMSETNLEKHESIDMNRILESGGTVRMVATSDFTIGVDTQEELILAEDFLRNDKSIGRYLEI
jgi:3-deoxy-manno-octulosonate cytidylyltransferase (CMP-KDO synthetase)